MWECRIVSQFVGIIFDFLNEEFNATLMLEESRNEYFFGLHAEKFPALMKWYIG